MYCGLTGTFAGNVFCLWVLHIALMQFWLCNGKCKGKGKIHPRTDHETPDSVLTDTVVICNLKHKMPPKISNVFFSVLINSLSIFNNCPTRCDLFSLLHFCMQLYMFRVFTPIIRSCGIDWLQWVKYTDINTNI